MLIPFDQLFKKHNVKADGVLHLGANTGQEAEAYQAQGIKSVIWVEADPTLFIGLKRHLLKVSNKTTTHHPICACVSDEDGQEVKFHIASNGGQSSSFLDFGTHAREHPTVRFTRDIRLRTLRVDTILLDADLELRGSWFLNADLQGAELMALKGMGNLLYGFNYAYIEVNERHLYKGCALVGEIDAYLLKYGLIGVEVKMTGSGWGDKFYHRVAHIG